MNALGIIGLCVVLLILTYVIGSQRDRIEVLEINIQRMNGRLAEAERAIWGTNLNAPEDGNGG